MIKETNSNESNTRKLEVSNGKIIYTLQLDGIQDYLTYQQPLYEILCMDKLKPFRDGGRLRLKVRKNGVDQNMYLYDLAIACYMGMVQKETFLEDMQHYFELKEQQGFTIDHLDNHVRNNTIFNLSPMKRSVNCKKSDIAARTEKPSLLLSCYVDGQYRVHYERHCVMCNYVIGDINRALKKDKMKMVTGVPQFTIAQSFACDDAEALVQCLGWIADRRILYKGVEMVLPMRSAKSGWNLSGIGGYTDNILTSIKSQEMLANRPAHEFQAFIYKQNNT